jgi:hypothetical protein
MSSFDPKEDPLSQIFVRTEQVEGEQRALLAQLILPFAGVNPETGDVYFKATADELLNAKQKILVYLLCRLALASQPNPSFSKYVSPKEVEVATRLPGGTVRPKLSQLVSEDKVVVKSGEGYVVPASYLNQIRSKNLLPIE